MATTTTQHRTATSNGIGFLGLLTITFVLLKALGYLDWSWWLVFLPVWGPLALVLLIFAVGVVVILIRDSTRTKRARKAREQRRRESRERAQQSQSTLSRIERNPNIPRY